MARKTTETKEPKKVCSSCKRELVIKHNFYNTNSPLSNDGKLDICKKCLQEMIDISNMNTVYKVLQLMDLPFYYDSWEGAKEKNPKNPWGIYIRQANSGLNSFEGATYADSIFESSKKGLEVNQSEEDNTSDKEYRTKLKHDTLWRGNYTQEDLDYLNGYLKQLKTDFKIITVNHMDYAKKIAKTSLLMDKAYEDILAGVSGAEKRFNDLQKTFDTLSKSAQFSENTRGANDVTLGCFGVIFDKVEQHRWIDTHVPMEKDEFDKLIEYFSTIDKSV